MILTGDLPEFRKYTEIPRIEKCKQVLDVPEVVVTEKINGSNFRVKVTKDGLILGSHNNTLDPATDKNFSAYFPIFEALDSEAIAAFFQEDLDDGFDVIIYGEIYGGGKMKGTTYKETKAFRVFDIFVEDSYFTWDSVVNTCADLGLETVPLIYRGKPDYDLFLSLVGKSSLTTEEDKGEGIVIKAYGYFDHNGRNLFAKMVSDRFAEVKDMPKVISPEKMAERETCKRFAECYVTEARVSKLVESLKEQDKYTGQMQDMKFLIPLLWADLEKEEMDAIQDMYDHYFDKKFINGACTKLLGKIYGSMFTEN